MPSEVERHTAGWHEARAADLLRPDDDGYGPAQADVDRAVAHARLATSMRLGELAASVRLQGRIGHALDGIARAVKRR